MLAFSLFSKEGIHWILQWWHVVFGIAWIGLLYYFNFVQVPSFPTMEAPHRNGAIDKLVPRALWYFRWAAAATAITGLAMIGLYAKDYYKANYGTAIYAGAAIGLLMLANVWLIIWPNQQIVIANARGLLAGEAAKPEVGAAGRKALLASRTNAILSILMLMFMTGAAHYFGQTNPLSPAILFWIVLVVIVGALEASALGMIGGFEGPLTKQIAGHPRQIAHLGVPIALVMLVLWEILT
jgi:Urate oxidase N-terminal